MTTDIIDEQRKRVASSSTKTHKSQLGQFFTASTIANFMSAMLRISDEDINLLDPGAGIGSLSTAVLQRLKSSDIRPNEINITSYEIDSKLIPLLRSNINAFRDQVDFNINSIVLNTDFIIDTAQNTPVKHFTHAILNPPYKKILSDSPHRIALRKLGIEAVNLYSGFLSIALQLLETNGELVAIVPRSFCNGTYFLPFRNLILSSSAIKQVHLFDSRTDAFNDDDVLQENVIIHLIKNSIQGNVIISRSSDATFTNIRRFEVLFDKIVKPNDTKVYFHIPEEQENELEQLEGISSTLNDLCIQVSTGPVVDFRMKEFLKQNPEKGTVPLLYSNHFSKTGITYPVDSKKPNAIILNDQTRRWLFPSGFYTVTKRFSSKEESQRIVARIITPTNVSSDSFGIENHLNVFHSNKMSLDKFIAYGLTAYLNSSLVDAYFRVFSGHTQVNATDLKQMVYPDVSVLTDLGKWAINQEKFAPNEIDVELKRLLNARSHQVK